MTTPIHPWGESSSSPPLIPPLDPGQRRAYLDALIANPRTNDGRRAWARAELKRMKG